MRLAAISRTLVAYGRAARMRSCALRILDAATISMALVIFLVFSTDLILPRISLPAAMSDLPLHSGEGFLERRDGLGQLCLILAFLVERTAFLQTLQQLAVAGLEELVQARLERQHPLDVD